MAMMSDSFMLHADSQAWSHARCSVCICISLAPDNLHEQCIHQTCQSACHAVKSGQSNCTGQSMHSMQGAERNVALLCFRRHRTAGIQQTTVLLTNFGWLLRSNRCDLRVVASLPLSVCSFCLLFLSAFSVCSSCLLFLSAPHTAACLTASGSL